MRLRWIWVTIALLMWPLAPGARGQGSRKDDIVLNARGLPLAGATVRVCAMPASEQPCTPLALIYSDVALTQALANPTTTDGLGNYYFYAAPGKYMIEISGTGITTRQMANVILPNDPTAPAFGSVSSSGAMSAFSLNLGGNLTVNGNATVVGSLAGGTLNLTNQGTAPSTPSAGTVNLYTKSADKRLYYKDDSGNEVGPVSVASGTVRVRQRESFFRLNVQRVRDQHRGRRYVRIPIRTLRRIHVQLLRRFLFRCAGVSRTAGHSFHGGPQRRRLRPLLVLPEHQF